MNRDDITRMARAAGFVGFDGENKCLRQFADLIAAAEREACAELCERMARRTDDIRSAALEMAAENIRARGNT